MKETIEDEIINFKQKVKNISSSYYKKRINNGITQFCHKNIE